jgi:hypothetical protein
VELTGWSLARGSTHFWQIRPQATFFFLKQYPQTTFHGLLFSNRTPIHSNVPSTSINIQIPFVFSQWSIWWSWSIHFRNVEIFLNNFNSISSPFCSIYFPTSPKKLCISQGSISPCNIYHVFGLKELHNLLWTRFVFIMCLYFFLNFWEHSFIRTKMMYLLGQKRLFPLFTGTTTKIKWAQRHTYMCATLFSESAVHND